MFGAFVTPRAEINGHPIELRWGPNTVAAPPGVHRIAIHMPWLWKFGRAEITVDNTAGPAPTVHYAMPWVNFGPGAIGLQPVSNPGLVYLAAGADRAAPAGRSPAAVGPPCSATDPSPRSLHQDPPRS